MAYITDQRAVAVAATGTVGQFKTEHVDCTDGAITRTLPAASGSLYHEFSFDKVDATANAVTITPAGSDTINGVAGSITLTAQWEGVTLVPNGELTGWVIKA